MTDQLEVAVPQRQTELSTHRQLELFRDLQRLANARQHSEQEIATTYRHIVDGAERAYKQKSQQIEKTFTAAREAAQKQHDSSLATENTQYNSLREKTQQAYQDNKSEIETHYKQTVESASAERKQSAWQTLSVFDASKDTPKIRLEERRGEISDQEQEVVALEGETAEILAMRNLKKVAEQVPEQPAGPPAADMQTAVAKVRKVVDALWQDKSTMWLEGATPWVTGGITTLLPVAALGFALGYANWLGYAIGAAVGLAASAGLLLLLAGKSRKAAADRLATIRQAISSAHQTARLAHEAAIAASRKEARQLIETRDRELAEIEARAKQTLAEVESWKAMAMEEVSGKFPAELTAMRSRHQQAVADIEKQLKASLDQITRQRDADSTAASNTRKQTLAEAEHQRSTNWQRMHNDWFAGYYAIRDELAAMTRRASDLTPDWRERSYAEWEKPAEPTLAIPFGESKLNLAKVKAAISTEEKLRPPETELVLPALLHLIEQPSMVVTAPDAQRGRAIGLLQAMLVRFLTAMPPGKVRLTLCDPMGLGESFSAFMHLADYDETLIASKIWTQPRDIDEQLLRLTTHMETILQSYLRDEYESIHEYNKQAGEVAEPFQVLAIADFPHGIGDTSMKRLLSLLKGGPRCGIYVLLAVDIAQKITGEMRLDMFTEGAVHLDWREKSNRFVWRYPAFEHLPLALPKPLPADRLVALMKNVGKAAQDAIKVEVPFSVVAPREELWQQTCDSEMRVPIGRAGANRLQYVRLGKGTSQHLLVAGKTGSGKSTFLHALVTSAAMHFSPREVEFYLVDFKKGVEFKSYATQQLPHARVIAIESEREFGISVLERLDEVLRERGEKFRGAGVQSLADYRASHPGDPMPRVLLVIDEFQELFVEDDKLASQAGLLLDRLIRQGRAFGMHVVLGSQTLAGAYSLARATLGQMAVRVALQCSEADAHLILSDERNQAARFLNRPGEAIYNDQNGMVTANEPFQVVWLSDSERSNNLAQVRAETQSRELKTPEPIVFEGNAPSRPSENEELVAAVGGDTPPVPRIWLGAAVSIRPPVRADFHRSAGSNLLLVGQNENIALGIMTTAAISLARGFGVRVDVIDGSRPEEPGTQAWPAIVQAGAGHIQLGTAREAAKVIEELADELARREQAGEESAPQRFLVVYNAARARDLRKSDDDLGFSFTKEKAPASASKQFLELLKNGPSWGIHVLLWSDSYNSLTRIIDRVTLREFDYRVVMQMAGGDSSNLIDTPAAARLNEHRALLYSDETGESEKIRPYQVPEANWLASL